MIPLFYIAFVEISKTNWPGQSGHITLFYRTCARQRYCRSCSEHRKIRHSSADFPGIAGNLYFENKIMKTLRSSALCFLKRAEHSVVRDYGHISFHRACAAAFVIIFFKKVLKKEDIENNQWFLIPNRSPFQCEKFLVTEVQLYGSSTVSTTISSLSFLSQLSRLACSTYTPWSHRHFLSHRYHSTMQYVHRLISNAPHISLSKRGREIRQFINKTNIVVYVLPNTVSFSRGHDVLYSTHLLECFIVSVDTERYSKQPWFHSFTVTANFFLWLSFAPVFHCFQNSSF